MTAQPKWFAHANVNCSDLDASEHFYVETLDLTARWRTEPSEVQDGAGFGMPGVPVRWEGAILTDRRGLRGPAVDLLRWIAPATSGTPYSTLSHLGFRALQFAVEDLDALVARLDAAGLLVDRRTYRDDHDHTHAVITTHDPGSTAVELVAGAAATTYTGVHVNCSDLDRSVEWYRNALGLAAAPNRVVDVLDDRADVVGRFRAADLFVRHHPRSFRLELTEWVDPQSSGTPYPVGNHAGVYRVALTVDDIDVAHADLRRALPDAPAPVTVDLGETLGPMRALFFTDPDGCVVELLEQGLPVSVLEGRVALVTGSTGAIGSEIVRQLAADGAIVIGADYAGDADVHFDVADAAAVSAAVDGVARDRGGIDILVNAAGIFGDMTRTDRIDPDVWDRYVKVDLSGPFYVIRATLPYMVERRWGRIVNLSSISSTEGGYRQAHYTAAKAGLIGLTRSIALEFATAGITCNAVLPGPIDTDKLAAVPDDVLAAALESIPARRMGTPADIAAAVRFLASPAAAYVNGISMPVDAGAMLLQFRFARHTRYDVPHPTEQPKDD